MSFRNGFGRRGEVLTYRAAFAEAWARFLRCEFDDPLAVAAAFGVNARTAENWWHGRNAPAGWAVGRALTDPRTRDAALAALGGRVAA
jgi:hypothetical protein